MRITDITGQGVFYPENIEGTREWFFSEEGETDGIYEEAVDAYDEEGYYAGRSCFLIHLEDRKIYRPFELKENVFVDDPFFLHGDFYFLETDFDKDVIRIWKYRPGSDKKLEAELKLNEILRDGTSPALIGDPLMLYQLTDEDEFVSYWPEQFSVPVNSGLDVIWREGDTLYLSEFDLMDEEPGFFPDDFDDDDDDDEDEFEDEEDEDEDYVFEGIGEEIDDYDFDDDEDDDDEDEDDDYVDDRQYIVEVSLEDGRIINRYEGTLTRVDDDKFWRT